MEYEKIKQLMDDMGNSKLSSIDIEFPDGIKIKMEKKIEAEQVIITKTEPKAVSMQEKIEVTATNNETVEGNIVTSPMVGTFYIKPSPNSEPYVEIGKQVKKGDVLCIVEAMKLMNEIESEYDGEIVEIYVKDGEAVEYGKPLFRIK